MKSGRRLVFIDVEASGLGPQSWPIEVAWVNLDGAAAATLIQPHPDWSMQAWMASAEALHGLTPDQVYREGAPVASIASNLNDTLHDATVISDAPAFDGFWLGRLFEAADLAPAFGLTDWMAALAPFGRASRLASAVERAATHAPRTHRALADARHLRAVYREIAGLGMD
ncbi:MAG: exonuclease domain-containing protein [Maricaulaceae bacterium]